MLELGILYDVVGVADAKLDLANVSEVVRRYPRLGFKRGFYDLLCKEVDSKQPYDHFHHICTCIAHNRGALSVPNAQMALSGAPFAD
jgi:hypothetical protein